MLAHQAGGVAFSVGGQSFFGQRSPDANAGTGTQSMDAGQEHGLCATSRPACQACAQRCWRAGGPVVLICVQVWSAAALFLTMYIPRYSGR